MEDFDNFEHDAVTSDSVYKNQECQEDDAIMDTAWPEGLTDDQFKKPPAAYSKKLPAPKTVYVVDFFSGCGGMSYGFANTRQSHTAFKLIGGIDINETALKTYSRNIPDAQAICADIFELAKNPSDLRQLLPDFDPIRCRPLVFIGCAPCQGFSAHRKKDSRNDVRNSLMVAFAKICKHYDPDVIVQENVPEILNGRYSSYHAEAKSILEKSGYKLSQAILDLSLFGVPQRRKRAIVLASKREPIALPQPLLSKDEVITVRDAISHLEPIKAGEADRNDPFHRAPSHTDRIISRIKQTPTDGGDRRSLPSNEQLICHANIDESKTPGFTDVYGRLYWDKPSVTITAKSSTPSCGRFLHPEQHRNISVREAAILQGFPQSFQFEGPFVNQYRQIGEAVPPLFARTLAWTVLDHLQPQQKALVAPQINAKDSNLKQPENSVLVVDGFCGAGGISLGFEQAGFKTAYAFDTNESAVATFSKNLSGTAECISIIDKQLPDRINSVVGNQKYVLVGGPPCQGFSQQRRGDNLDERNNLVLEFSNLLSKLHNPPIAVVLENVTYLDSPRGRHIFAEYTNSLERLGYNMTRLDLNSADFGVPQLRRRIVSIGLKSDCAGQFAQPKATFADRWPTIGEALCGLPEPRSSESICSIANHVPSREGPLNKRRVSYVDMGCGRMSVPDKLQLKCHTKYGGHLDVYGRLDWFAQARTITGGFDSFTRGEYAHPFRHRSITAREAARIQGFPDDFVFEGNRSEVRKQIGNAVPPPMAYSIATALLQSVSE